MTRARARAIETEVTSLLNELPYDPEDPRGGARETSLQVLR